MNEIATAVIFSLVGVLFIALANPPMRRAVPPHPLSGLRVRATFADPEEWHEANAATGRDLALLGVVVLVLAVILPWTTGSSSTAVLTVLVVGGAIALGLVVRARANRLLAERQRHSPSCPTSSTSSSRLS